MLLFLVVFPPLALAYLDNSDYFLIGELSTDDYIQPECIQDTLNLFSEGKKQPENFMDLTSSSEGDNVNDEGNNDNNGNNIYNEKVEVGINDSKKLNPSTGQSQSSKVPQTEFEKQPYLDNPPLPKSQSDATSLGKNK